MKHLQCRDFVAGTTASPGARLRAGFAASRNHLRLSRGDRLHDEAVQRLQD